MRSCQLRRRSILEWLKSRLKEFFSGKVHEVLTMLWLFHLVGARLS
jgi:hypothetical protein